MIQGRVSASLLKQAKKHAADLGALNHSIRKGEGNVVGFIGEAIVERYLKAQKKNTYDYDLVSEGKKIDVKTKECSGQPEPHFECSIAAYNIKQRCDYYFFVRVRKDHAQAWILGYIKKDDYFRKARFCKKGEVDPKSELGWKFKEDCYNLEIKDLIQVERK